MPVGAPSRLVAPILALAPTPQSTEGHSPQRALTDWERARTVKPEVGRPNVGEGQWGRALPPVPESSVTEAVVRRPVVVVRPLGQQGEGGVEHASVLRVRPLPQVAGLPTKFRSTAVLLLEGPEVRKQEGGEGVGVQRDVSARLHSQLEFGFRGTTPWRLELARISAQAGTALETRMQVALE